ncbi:TELO2-interacting protein 2 [Rhipicephalus sanguineus]|uniref:TELO2-interacting protein 2 n=1 Tax=Rhipicephalus sanguineus TaxID=34632 RepID=UPI0018953924|nr:TELO2-interacting protein 2 [Rhipicephalus sanguineus]
MELARSFISEKCPVKKLALLRALRATLGTLRPDDAKTDSGTLYALAQSLLLSGIPKDSSDDEEREHKKKDFPGVAEAATEGMICAHLLIRTVASEFTEHLATPLRVLCFAHSKSELPWCSDESVAASSALSSQLNSSFSAPELRLSVLKYIRPKLAKKTWKKNPCYRYVYREVLFDLSPNDVRDALSVVVAPALLLVDDYMTYNQRLGLACVRRIVVSVPPSELDQYGRLELLFDALKHLLYVKEPDIIVQLHTCLRNLIFADYLDALHIKDHRRQIMAGDVYCEVLTAAEVEQTFALRKAYSSQFSPYIRCLGMDVAKYMNRTLRVLLEYIQVEDTDEQTCRRNALLSLAELTKQMWPRITFHFGRITESIFKLACDQCEHRNSALWDEIGRCLDLLQQSCPEHYQRFHEDLLFLREQNLPGIASLLACSCTEQR